jgi:hypothetical protein
LNQRSTDLGIVEESGFQGFGITRSGTGLTDAEIVRSSPRSPEWCQSAASDCQRCEQDPSSNRKNENRLPKFAVARNSSFSFIAAIENGLPP